MKRILITGATSGIGEAVSRYYNENYADTGLVLIGRREEKLKELVNEFGPENHYIAFDFCGDSDISQIFEQCKKWGFKLDGMIHCAGTSIDMPVRSLNMDDVRNMYQTCLFSFLELGKYFSKKKYSNEGSSIVTMSSYSTRTVNKGMIAYTGIKAAMEASLKVMAKELQSRKIRVNGVGPAYVKTPMVVDNVVMERIESGEWEQDFGIIPVEQVVYMIDFLMSNKAEYITGEIMYIPAGVRV